MTDFQKYIQRYQDLVIESSLSEALANSEVETLAIYSRLNDHTSLYKYTENKWTLKEVLLHIIDCERVFQYRILAISRGDMQSLPGFDEDLYVQNSFADSRLLEDLINEYQLVRASSAILLKNLKPDIFELVGLANNNEISVATISKLIIGHNRHHLNIINERYMN